jgi:MutS domain I
VKTLDELLILKPQFKGEGFVLQAPRAKESGGRYYLDEQIIAAVGSDFHSVGDRMEVVIPPERLEQTLHVVMKQRNYTLAAFDFKDQARKFLGIELPELRAVELEPITPPIRQNAKPVLAETAETAEITPPAVATARVAPVHQQIGGVEKNIARFLEQAGLAEAVLADPEFYLVIPNEPYISLTVERHDQDFHLIHWLKDSYGDLFIDAEMVFELTNDGKLNLSETATQNPLTGGESRGCDRGFARIFSRNILDQGFAAAALRLEQSANETSEQPARRWENLATIDRTALAPFAVDYLKAKDQHPDVLQRDRPGNFYVAYFTDAETIAPALPILLMLKRSPQHWACS